MTGRLLSARKGFLVRTEFGQVEVAFSGLNCLTVLALPQYAGRLVWEGRSFTVCQEMHREKPGERWSWVADEGGGFPVWKEEDGDCSEAIPVPVLVAMEAAVVVAEESCPALPLRAEADSAASKLGMAERALRSAVEAHSEAVERSAAALSALASYVEKEAAPLF